MIFLDSGAFLGRYLPSDQHYHSATLGWQKIREERLQCYTSNLVISESLTLLARKAHYRFAVERGRKIYLSNSLKILRSDEDDEKQAITLFGKFADQKISFTDCISFVLMRKHKIHYVFGFDRHFELAGFNIWMK